MYLADTQDNPRSRDLYSNKKQRKLSIYKSKRQQELAINKRKVPVKEEFCQHKKEQNHLSSNLKF